MTLRSLRTDRAAQFTIGYLALGALVLFNRGMPWRGEWAWTLDTCLGTTVLVGPLLTAAATYVVATERRRAELTDPTVRGWQVPLRRAGAALGWALAAFTAAVVVACALTATVPHGGPAEVWVLTMPPITLAAYAALGMVAGHRWTSLVMVPVAGIVAFAIGLAGALGIGPNLLRQGPVSGSLAGLRWDLAVFAGQVATLLGATLLLAVLVLPSAWRRRAPLVLVGATGAALIVCGLVGLSSTGDEAFIASDETASVCAGQHPQVCVAPSNQRGLASMAAQTDRLAAVLTDVGADVPSRYAELLPYWTPPRDEGMFSLDVANAASVGSYEAAGALVLPAPCPAWFGGRPPATRVFEAQQLLRWWVLHRGGDKQGPSYDAHAAAWLRLPIGEQATWVRSTFASLRDCRFADIHLPWR